MDLHTAGHYRGVVAAPHYAAADVGRAVLAEGGNALEATVAMAAMIAVVYPHMNHVGGDGFWLIHQPGGWMRALMAAGRAGAKATPELYREHGYELIPARGPLAALTVPGAVSGWSHAWEIARSLGGRLPLYVLLDRAIRRAREGYTPSRSQIQLTTDKLAELKDVPGFAATFLADGKPPQSAALLKQTALAETLEHLAHAGFDDFYRGDVGREIAADLEKIGSPVTRRDLEDHRATMVEPLHVNLTSGVLYNTPPPTQGLASLIIPALFERLRVTDAETFDHVHGLVEATKRALSIRDRTITDPSRVPGRLDDYLAREFLDAEARNISKEKAAPWPAPKAKGDTVWLGAAEASGLVVSYIQSLYWEFGSGCVLPSTGVLMQNRGASFSLKPGSLRLLAPGRMPFHTLNPALAVLNDGRVMAYGTMGGDGQPQTHAAVFTRHVLYRQPLEEAIDRPRWVLGRTWGAPRANLRVEPRFEDRVIKRLVEAGHDVEVLHEPYADAMGHAGAVVCHSDGTLEGAH
ncbi:MAG: gamma-glutamyltransferase, partial [Bradyrhizobiaceae bacterium]|nr:gamma-glutamyltransferase [Bradyrhizobiaceae bacterium]